MNGKLTAEQVREAVMSADRWEKPMGNTGLTNTHLIIRDDGWQAIAEELNTTLGGGECKAVASSIDGLMTVELIANRDESIHNLVKVLDKRQERIKALESLVRDMRNLMATPAWDRGGWSTDGKCVEFDTRMAELGIEMSE